MELITYVHNELAFEWANNGVTVEPPLNCHALTQLKQTTQNVALVGCAGMLAASLTVGGLAHAQTSSQTTTASEATVTAGSVVNTTTASTSVSASTTNASTNGSANASVTSSSDDVVALQNLLAQRGFQPGPIDGIRGPQTEAAILRSQAFYKLSQDGIAGAQTLAALQEDTYEATAETGAAANPEDKPEQSSDQKPDKNKDNEKPAASPNEKPTLTLTPAEITANQQVQALLKDRGFYSDAIDGIAGPKTKAAIRQAQVAYNLTVDGVAGPQTIAALEKDQRPEPMPQNKPVEPSTAAQPKPVPETAVALASSSQVAEAQKLMTELGFYQGAIDGIAGPATTTAVKRAQAFYGLPVDGVIGANTLQSLRA